MVFRSDTAEHDESDFVQFEITIKEENASGQNASGIVVANGVSGSGPLFNQDLVVDFDYCFSALDRHDTNSDLRLDPDEFFGFAQDFGSATESLGTLDGMPLELSLVFNQLACECRQQGGQADCCLGENGIIPLAGACTGYVEDDPEQDFLRQVCLRTDQVIITYCSPAQNENEPSGGQLSQGSKPTRGVRTAFGQSRKDIIVGGPFLLLLGLLASCRLLNLRAKKCRCDKGNSSDAASFCSDDDELSSSGKGSAVQWIETFGSNGGKWIFSPLEETAGKHVSMQEYVARDERVGGDDIAPTMTPFLNPNAEGGSCSQSRILDLGELDKEWEDEDTFCFYEQHLTSMGTYCLLWI